MGGASHARRPNAERGIWSTTMVGPQLAASTASLRNSTLLSTCTGPVLIAMGLPLRISDSQKQSNLKDEPRSAWTDCEK